ncbi:MAG TPA: hypothetical protein VF240_18585 [Pyrinomonadaceae bacterium]
MKYLLRAARRTELAGASPRARPAIPIRSPLAEADQRLNIDSFAARFDAPAVAERAAPHTPEEEPFPVPASERQAGTSAAAAESRPTPSAAPAAPRRSRGETSHEPARGKDVRESQQHTAPPHTTRDARPRGRLSPGDTEDKSAPLLSARPVRRVNELPGPLHAEGDGPVPERPRVNEQAKTAKGEQPPSGNMLDALSRALAWVEGDARRTAEAERAEVQATPPAPAPRARFDERERGRSSEAAQRDLRPVTHLEIGKIEVEIMPPAKPAQNAAAPRREPRTNGLSYPRRQPFGWRQR